MVIRGKEMLILLLRRGVGYVCEDICWKGRLSFRILMASVGVLLLV